MRFETGNDLKLWRLEHHMTQKDLADRIGYTKDRVAHLEKDNDGKSHLSKRIQKALIKLDNSVNDDLIYAWRRCITNKTFMSFFSDEFISLGKSLSESINKIPKGFNSTVAYIKLLDLYIRTFLQVSQTSKNIKSTIQILIRETNDYRKKYLS